MSGAHTPRPRLSHAQREILAAMLVLERASLPEIARCVGIGDHDRLARHVAGLRGLGLIVGEFREYAINLDGMRKMGLIADIEHSWADGIRQAMRIATRLLHNETSIYGEAPVRRGPSERGRG